MYKYFNLLNKYFPDINNSKLETLYIESNNQSFNYIWDESSNDFANELSTLHGSGFSIQPRFTQSAYFRFHNKSEIFNNLYFVGAGTHPGAGMPGVLSSAKVLDELL